MVNEAQMLKVSFIISAVIHVSGFGLFWSSYHSRFHNNCGESKDDFVVFQIGWTDAVKKRVKSAHPVALKKKDMEDVNAVLPKKGTLEESDKCSDKEFNNGLSGEKGSSGYAKQSRGMSDNEYLLKVRKCIERAKYYPEYARKRLFYGNVVVNFYISRDGNPENISIVKSSGFYILDNTAREIITRASPFPKPPGEAGEKNIQTTIVFTPLEVY